MVSTCAYFYGGICICYECDLCEETCTYAKTGECDTCKYYKTMDMGTGSLFDE